LLTLKGGVPSAQAAHTQDERQHGQRRRQFGGTDRRGREALSGAATGGGSSESGDALGPPGSGKLFGRRIVVAGLLDRSRERLVLRELVVRALFAPGRIVEASMRSVQSANIFSARSRPIRVANADISLPRCPIVRR
jgi:hypothetical protein